MFKLVLTFYLDVLIIFFLAQAAQVNFVVGSHVWVEDPELAWIDGEVLEVDNEDIKIESTYGKTVRVASQPYIIMLEIHIFFAYG